MSDFGGTPVLVRTGADPVVAAQAGVPEKETFAVDRLAGDLVVSDYAALVLPGTKFLRAAGQCGSVALCG